MEGARFTIPSAALLAKVVDMIDKVPSERERPRSVQSFCVPKAELVARGYDLSFNRYKEVIHAEIAHRPPRELLADLAKLEAEIQQGMKELEGMLE